MQHICLKDKSFCIDNLPSEPSLLVELLELCHDDTASFEVFSTAIQKDAALTAKILRVATSPTYRQWNELTDVRRMLIVLGMTNVKNIVTTCAIQQFFANFTEKFSKNIQFVWLRALICANLSERIAKLIGYEKPGEAFLAGLLHQIGILLLLLNREVDYLPILDQYYIETENFCVLEHEKLQVNHCELGAALVESWKLDSFIADAIHFQNSSAEELSGSPLLLKILAIAAPLSSKNSARDNCDYLKKAGLLFNMTEEIILDCLDLAREKSTQMITDLGFNDQLYMEKTGDGTFNTTQHETNRKKLAEQVKNIALSSTIGKSEPIDLIEFSQEIRIIFNTLFNLKQVLFFRVDENQTTLSAINDLDMHQLNELKFSTKDKYSLLIKAFNEKIDCISLFEKSSITDQQIIRLLDADGAYFLPIYHDGTQLGVLALGTTEQEWTHLRNKTPLLKLLGSEVARKYLSLSQGLAQSTSMSSVDFQKIVHEVSNPLTIINNYLYMLGKKIDADHSAQEEIKFITEEIERVGNILLRAKESETPTKEQCKPVDINKLLTDLDTLFSGSLYITRQIESTLILDE
ncbi:MAG: HDOD domain-containing protein, partial [Thermodesulfobacteriota bacterium]|nr:HDOD domain-containing protein [Thermodesulfobacteriota bacterium]